MKRGVVIGIIAGIVLIVLIVVFLILTKNNPSDENDGIQSADSNQMVDCGMMDNPSCFSNRMDSCLPVTGILTATDGITPIQLTVLGVENGTCHFQRKINNTMDMNCYFPNGNLSWDLIDQTFGNDKGLQNIVDDSCKHV
jgi:hypothetical protein